MQTQKQPKSLYLLSLTEMGERFAYYGVQSILTLYMIRHLGFSDSDAYLIYGAAGALIFITPVLGGYFADYILGYQRAIVFGGVLLTIGYLGLCLDELYAFYLALSFVICGNGFLKPNISALLGTVYIKNDPRRERGYTLFYVGINLGGILGFILCGVAQKTIGWTGSFLVAVLFLAAVLVVFILSSHRIAADIEAVGNRLPDGYKFSMAQAAVIILTVVLLLLFSQLLWHPLWISHLLIVFTAILLAILTTITGRLPVYSRRKLIVCFILTAFSIVFWALFEQAPMTLTLFVARCVNLNIFGIEIPATSIWALNAIFLVLLAPFSIYLWRVLAEKNRDLSLPVKFALGIFFIACAYLLLTFSVYIHQSHVFKLSIVWIVLSYMLQTMGELCLSPIGLSMISVLSPPEMRGMMMGVWFFALAVGTNIAGHFARLASIHNHHIVTWPVASKVYAHAFFIYGVAGLAFALLLFLITPVLKKMLA